MAVGTVVVGSSATGAWQGQGTPAPGRFIAVGDSIMLGARSELESRLAFLGWPSALDMEVSRSTSAGAEAIKFHAPGPNDTLVISLGANDSGDLELFRVRVAEVLAASTNAAKVYWLTIPEVRPYYPAANMVLREAAANSPNVGVIEWSAVTAATPGLTARDGLHLTASGSKAMADTILERVLVDAVGQGSSSAVGDSTTTTIAEQPDGAVGPIEPGADDPTSSPVPTGPSRSTTPNGEGVGGSVETSDRTTPRPPGMVAIGAVVVAVLVVAALVAGVAVKVVAVKAGRVRRGGVADSESGIQD